MQREHSCPDKIMNFLDDFAHCCLRERNFIDLLVNCPSCHLKHICDPFAEELGNLQEKILGLKCPSRDSKCGSTLKVSPGHYEIVSGLTRKDRLRFALCSELYLLEETLPQLH